MCCGRVCWGYGGGRRVKSVDYSAEVVDEGFARARGQEKAGGEQPH